MRDNRGTPSSVRNVDFVGAGVEATFEGDTLRVFVQAGSQGFVAITDIAPTNPSDNVGTKVKPMTIMYYSLVSVQHQTSLFGRYRSRNFGPTLSQVLRLMAWLLHYHATL